MNTRAGIIVVPLLCAFAASAAADNIVPNGSFENGYYYCLPDTNGDCNPGTASGPGPGVDTVADGWYNLPPASQSDFQIESGPYSAEDGSFYAAFMSASGTNDQDCFTVDLDTVAGQLYTISFWVSITAPSVSNTSLDPQWQWNQPNTVDMTEAAYHTPTAGSTLGWTQYTFTETAESDWTYLMFHGTDANGAILLDNVVVTASSAAPEPASLLLISSGLLIIALRRTQRNYR
jgi:hypothetical protein